MLCLGYHAGELAVHAWNLGNELHVAGPGFQCSVGDKGFCDVVDHHPEARHLVREFRDEGEMGGAE